MAEVTKDLQFTKLWGNYVPLPQHEKADGSMSMTGENNPLPMDMSSSRIIQPVDIQARLTQIIQTHTNQALLATTGTSTSAWVNVEGFDKIHCHLANDAATNSRMDVQWSEDGVNMRSEEKLVLPVGTDRYRVTPTIEVKFSYFRVVLYNTDGAPHTMNAWANLKA